MIRHVKLVLAVEDQPRLRELMAMWASGQVGVQEVEHPEVTGPDRNQLVGTVTITDLMECEVVEP